MNSIELSPPFVTTSVETVKALVELLKDYIGEPIVDLGSGDGRVIVELGKKGHNVTGFETNPELVKRTKERISQLGLEKTVCVFEKNYWDENLSTFKIAYIYGIPSIMGKVEEKLEKELAPGSIVISNIYRLPSWKPKKVIKGFNIYKKA